MPRESDRYTYRITWSKEDKEHVGLCVEFPSLSWLAESPELALKGIRKIVEDVIKEMKSNEESPPEPLSSKKFSGKFVVRIPPELHRSLTIEAEEQGISLNRLVSAKLSQ
jgi:predicted HicB family RNase H-like nuclease